MQATSLGTSVGDSISLLAITANEIYVAGGTAAVSFPAVDGGAQEDYGGGTGDGFVAREVVIVTLSTGRTGTSVAMPASTRCAVVVVGPRSRKH